MVGVYIMASIMNKITYSGMVITQNVEKWGRGNSSMLNWDKMFRKLLNLEFPQTALFI
jgi:hypothetical protein